MTSKTDQTKYSQISLEILHQESILPILPLMNHWATLAFQKPPYSFAGVATNELIDPQDLFYVNDPNAIVVIAKSEGEVIGIAAGLPFDSKDLQSYFESRNEETYKEIIKLGFDPLQMFYLTYILIFPEFKEKSLLSCTIFDAIKNWAVKKGKKQICWQKDVSYFSVSEAENVETWKKDVDGFMKMGIQFKFCWPTCQVDGKIKESEHTMEFFYKEI